MKFNYFKGFEFFKLLRISGFCQFFSQAFHWISRFFNICQVFFKGFKFFRIFLQVLGGFSIIFKVLSFSDFLWLFQGGSQFFVEAFQWISRFFIIFKFFLRFSSLFNVFQGWPSKKLSLSICGLGCVEPFFQIQIQIYDLA